MNRIARGAATVARLARSGAQQLAGATYRGQRAGTLLYCADADRGTMIEGRRFAQILDSWWLLNDDGEGALTLAPIGSRVVGRKAFGVVTVPSLWATLRDLAAAVAGGDLRRENRARDYFRGVLKTSGARRVVGIQPPEALVTACADLGVPVYDLQHGSTAPRNGYYEHLGRESDVLRFLVWNETTRVLMMDELDVATDRIEVVGNPLLALFERPPAAVRGWVDGARQAARRSLGPKPDRPVILVTLQWAMDVFHPAFFDNPFIPAGLADAVRASPRATFWIRPHPLLAKDGRKGWDGVVRELGGAPDLRLCDPLDVALPAALELADGHITWDSSAVIEATAMGVPSLVLNPGPHAERDWSGAAVPVPPDAPRALAHYAITGLVYFPRIESRTPAADIETFVTKIHAARGASPGRR